MKKLFLFLFFLLVGCSEAEKPISIYDLSTKIDEIELNTLNIEESVATVEREILEDELIDVSSDIAKIIDLNQLKQYVFYQSEETYIFIYETNDYKISNIINNYFDDLATKQITISLREKLKERVEYKYEDFYIYIVGDNSNKILERILDTKNKLFENTILLSDDAIKEKFGFEIKDSVVKFSTKLNNEIGYILIPNATSEIEEKLDNYYNAKTDNLSKNKLKYNKGNNLIYVVSYDNNKVLKILESTNLE